jgi:Uma2 family endonuclease
MSIQVLRRTFTVDEYHRMANAGIFREDDRIELLDGEILEMTPIGSRHAATVDRLNQLFSDRARRRAIVRIQSPIRISERSEPQPDVALLQPRADFYAQAHPGPEDVILVVEVAETSVEVDRSVKVPLYARAGIPEVWLMDLSGDCIEVFQEPSPQGYQEIQRVRRGDRLAPRAFPDLDLAVHDLLA